MDVTLGRQKLSQTVRKIPNKQQSGEQKVKMFGLKAKSNEKFDMSFISALYVACLVTICAATCKSNSEASAP